ncbi:hypothetical protein RFI_00726 [Reticulomyxa filosa]|uniref:Uncharacterized protein n=1 Tax=Reticulomyxa filosa TaxID=46433 RepID=X6PF86_RETFI|nr:hypothetical protein RFI_00726 [Reticulomyxa filosa]|eukprot:ETO36337.1 hypothetical protein RFI_00726 [Reticulomyxa filosa]
MLVELLRCDEWTIEDLFESSQTKAAQERENQNTSNKGPRPTLSRRKRHQQQQQNKADSGSNRDDKSSSLLHQVVRLTMSGAHKKNEHQKFFISYIFFFNYCYLYIFFLFFISLPKKKKVTPSWIASSALSLLSQRLDAMQSNENEAKTDLKEKAQSLLSYLNEWPVLFRMTVQLEKLCQKIDLPNNQTTTNENDNNDNNGNDDADDNAMSNETSKWAKPISQQQCQTMFLLFAIESSMRLKLAFLKTGLTANVSQESKNKNNTSNELEQPDLSPAKTSLALLVQKQTLLKMIECCDNKINEFLCQITETALKLLTNVTHNRTVKLKEETLQALFDIFGHFEKFEMVDCSVVCLSVLVNCAERNQTFQKQFYAYNLNGTNALQYMVEHFFRLFGMINDIEAAENSHDIVARDCHKYSSNKLLLFCLALLLGFLLQDSTQSKRIWRSLLGLCKAENVHQTQQTKTLLKDHIVKVLKEFVTIKLDNKGSGVKCVLKDQKLLSIIGQISKVADIRDQELFTNQS